MLRKIWTETKENPGLVGLAGIGFTLGVYETMIKPELTAKRAWVVMGLGILAYEMAAPPGQLLSEGADRSLTKYPWLTRAAIGVTALHLANALPEQVDPYPRVLKFIKPRV